MEVYLFLGFIDDLSSCGFFCRSLWGCYKYQKDFKKRYNKFINVEYWNYICKRGDNYRK